MKRVWLVPAAAALFYPFLLAAFHASLGAGAHLGPLSWLCLGLALAAPIPGAILAARLGALVAPTRNELTAKRIALLSVAAPPIFTTLGVVTYLVKSPLGDLPIWAAAWLVIIAIAARAALAPPRPTTPAAEPPLRLRVAHGITAAFVILVFLAMHLTSHLSALWNVPAERALMGAFRTIYRAHVVEPVLVTALLFLCASGLALLWTHSRRAADGFRSLQLATGAYLLFFVPGHMNSVFVYARTALGIPTDWNFATGAPAGMLADAWNIRLLPHYLYGVFAVLTHLSLGARAVALEHGVSPARAARWTKAGIAGAAVVATAIIAAMVGAHLA